MASHDVNIDLQRGIVARPGAPRTGAEVVQNAIRLATAAREKGALVVLVHVSFPPDFANAIQADVDERAAFPPTPGWDELVDELAPFGDVVVVKRQWGAFYGTSLDLELRRRGRKTLILGGIATNFGVESTARDGWERNYQLVLVEDAMTAFSAENHTFAITKIFPRLGRVCQTEDVLKVWTPTA